MGRSLLASTSIIFAVSDSVYGQITLKLSLTAKTFFAALALLRHMPGVPTARTVTICLMRFRIRTGALGDGADNATETRWLDSAKNNEFVK